MKTLDDVLDTLKEDAPVREIRVGAHWVAVCSRHCGLASTLGQAGGSDAEGFSGRSARELAELARSDTLPEASLGMAAVNSLLEVDEGLSVDLNARDLLIERGRGKRVALVGHFPFVPALREAAGHLWVLELLPRPGDLPAAETPGAEAQALVDLVWTAPEEDLLSVGEPFDYAWSEPEEVVRFLTCEVCGEIMAEQYAPLVKGKTMCIPCSGYES